MSACLFSRRNKVLIVGASLFVGLGVSAWAQAEPPPPNPPPVVTITTVDAVATEQSPFIDAIPDTAELRVHRDGSWDQPLTVFYLVRGTATHGKDYALLGGELTVPAGQRSASLIIDPLDDDEVEPIETVVVNVIPKEIAPGGETGPGYYLVGQPDTARAFIMDDEPQPNVPPTVAIVSPPHGALLSLRQEIHILAEARDSDGWVTAVEFFVDGASIGVAEGIPWPPEPIRPMDVLNDPDWRQPHLFRIRWDETTQGRRVLTAVAEDNLGDRSKSEPVEVQLLDIPEPVVVQVLATDPEGGEGPLGDTLEAIPDPARFTLVRSGPVDFPLEVYFELGGTAMNGVDYQELAGSVVIPEGARGVEVIIDPIDDPVPEPTETVTLRVIPPVCIEIFPPPRECYLVGTPAMARVLIRDNDSPGNTPPRVRMLDPQDGQVVRGPTDIGLTAAAWDADGSVVSVEFFAGDRSLGIVTEPDPMPLPAELDEFEDPSLMLPRYSMAWPDVPPGHYRLSALATDDGGITAASSPVHLWVIDAADVQIVSVEASDPDATEPGVLTPDPGVLDTGMFTLRRMGSVETDLTVYYRLGGTALNGIDYDELPHRVLIPAGETSVNLEVRPLPDGRVEGTEHVDLRLLPFCCLADAGESRTQFYIVGEPGSARVAIHDLDQSGNVPPRVKLVRPVEGQVFVGPRAIELVAVAQDPDGWVPAVQFFAGEEWIGTSEIVYIREPDPGLPQTFSMTWDAVPPGRHALSARAVDDDGAGTTSDMVRISVVQSDVLPVVTVEATDPRASEGGILAVIDSAVFTVQRRGDLAEPLTVFYSVSGTAGNGVDYQKLSGVLEIPAGSSTGTIEVLPIGDNLEEDVETVILRLEAPECPAIFPPPPGCYMVGTPGWALAGIVDGSGAVNGPPRAEIVRPFPDAVYHAPATISVATQARDRDGYVTLVEWFANDEKIGEQSMQFLTPPPPGQPQLFEFSWRGVPAGRYLLTARATDNQGTRSEISESAGVAVIPADDVPVVTLFVADPLAQEQPNADGTIDTATFKVRRSGPLDQPLVVFYSVRGTAENGVDYTALDGQATIPSGNRWTRITVLPMNDTLAEDPETVVLELTPSPAASPIEPYRVGSPKVAAALIFDDDDPAAPKQRVRNWLHLRLPGTPGAAYRLEVSENLHDWRALTDGWADDSGMHHIEESPDEFPQRFYRVRPLAPELMGQPGVVGREW